MKPDTIQHVPDQNMTSRRRQNGQRGLLSALSLKPPANVLLDRSALYWSGAGGNISTFCLQAHLDSNMCSTDDWEDLQSSSFTSQLENIHKKSSRFLGATEVYVLSLTADDIYTFSSCHLLSVSIKNDRTFQGLCFKTCSCNLGYFCS